VTVHCTAVGQKISVLGSYFLTKVSVIIVIGSNPGRSVQHGLWTEVKEGVEYREEGSMKVSRKK